MEQGKIYAVTMGNHKGFAKLNEDGTKAVFSYSSDFKGCMFVKVERLEFK